MTFIDRNLLSFCYANVTCNRLTFQIKMLSQLGTLSITLFYKIRESKLFIRVKLSLTFEHQFSCSTPVIVI